MCPMNFAKFPMDAHTCKFQVIAHSKMYNMVEIYGTICVISCSWIILAVISLQYIQNLEFFATQFSMESKESYVVQ